MNKPTAADTAKPTPATTPARPNILVIMYDQIAASALRCYGNPTTKTPNIDRLAAEGVVFDNAYCNSPLCTPARYCLMTGQLPTQTGGYDNAAYLPSTVPTVAHYLRAAGYRTMLSGKMHFVGPDQLHGFEERRRTHRLVVPQHVERHWRRRSGSDQPIAVRRRSRQQRRPCFARCGSR